VRGLQIFSFLSFAKLYPSYTQDVSRSAHGVTPAAWRSATGSVLLCRGLVLGAVGPEIGP
jgi:hypothetical protein